MTDPAAGAYSPPPSPPAAKKPGTLRRMAGYWKTAPITIKATTILWTVAAGLSVLGPMLYVGVTIATALTAQATWNQLGDTYGQQGYYPGVILAQASKPDPTLMIAYAVFILVVGAVATIGYILLGYLVLAGSNVARIIATCLAGLSFVMLFPLGPSAMIWIALGIAGTICAWMPTASAYIAVSAQRKASNVVLP